MCAPCVSAQVNSLNKFIAMKSQSKIGVILMALVFTARNAVGKIIDTAGQYLASISEVSMDEAVGDGSHKDKTPQLKVVFDIAGKRFTNWYNLKGYKKFEDLTAAEKKVHTASAQGYAVDKKGYRVENEENTKKAMSIIERLGLDAGIEAGESFQPEDLVSREVGINIEKNAQGNLRVTYSLSPDRLV